MSETPNLTDYKNIAKTIAITNADILDQNERAELSHTIDDDDFKKLALDGIYAEQEASVIRRSELATPLDYHKIGREMNALDDTIQVHEAEIANLNKAAQAIKDQAELAKKVAPRQAEAIDAMTEVKLTVNEDIAGETRSILSFSQNQQRTYESLGMPWTVPALYKLEQQPATKEELETILTTESDPSSIEDLAEEIGERAIRNEVKQDINLPVENATSVEVNLDTIINSVLWAVCDYAMKNSEAGVRVEEMRRNVPELAELSAQEYQLFKDRFAGIRKIMEQRLTDYGMQPSWRVSGQTRGTRYHLTTSEQSATSQPRKLFRDPVLVDTTKISAAAKNEEVINKSETDGSEVVPPTESTVEQTDLANLPLVKSMLETISQAQINAAHTPLRRTVIVRAISESLGIPETDAGAYVSELIGGNLLHSHGSLKGSKVFSTVPYLKEGETQTDKSSDVAIKNPTDDIEEGVEELATDEFEVDAKQRALKVFKAIANSGPFGGISQDLTLSQVAKQFGFKRNFELAREAEKAVKWLIANPLTPSSRKIKAYKNTAIDDGVYNLLRFSPQNCPELTVKNIFNRYRIVYAVTDESLVLIDILDHDSFDIKYK